MNKPMETKAILNYHKKLFKKFKKDLTELEKEEKRPFVLTEFLKQNLKPKNFVEGEYNYYIFFDNDSEKWSYDYVETNELMQQFFECVTDSIINILNSKAIIPAQMRLSFKELGWL